MASEGIRESVGGAFFVVRNLERLGARFLDFTLPCGVEKRRFWVDGYKLFQVDSTAVTESTNFSLSDFDKALEHYTVGIVIFSDYRHGVLKEPFVRGAIEMCRAGKIITMADSQVSQQHSNHDWYADVDYMFMNRKEYDSIPNPHRIGLNQILKLGEGGAVLYESTSSSHAPLRVAGIPVNAVDTCGAGDCFLAAFAAFHHLGHKEALLRANMWAAHSCTLPGTQVPKYADVFPN